MILIVGGAGYIGSHICKELYKKSYNIIVFDNLINGHKEFLKWGKFIFGDLRDIQQLRALFKQYNIKVVIHLASLAYVDESMKNPQKYYINNVKYTLNLLQVMLEYKIKNFIFSSSCAIYGNPVKNPISEEHSLIPINPYGETKLMVEKILENYSRAYGIKYISLRYFNAAGTDIDYEIGEWHEPEPHLIPRVLDVALGKLKHIEIFGIKYDTPDGTCIRDYIHVTDLANAHILALEYLLKERRSTIFNLSSGKGISVKEVIKIAEEVTKKEIKFKARDRRQSDPSILIGNANQAKKILGWIPKYNNLIEIIQTAWQWHEILYKNYKH